MESSSPILSRFRQLCSLSAEWLHLCGLHPTRAVPKPLYSCGTKRVNGWCVLPDVRTPELIPADNRADGLGRVAAGVYFARLTTDEYQAEKKLVLVK